MKPREWHKTKFYFLSQQICIERAAVTVVRSDERVLHVVAEGENVIDANALADKAADLIRVEGDTREHLLYHRHDIGERDIKRYFTFIK